MSIEIKFHILCLLKKNLSIHPNRSPNKQTKPPFCLHKPFGCSLLTISKEIEETKTLEKKNFFYSIIIINLLLYGHS